MDCFVATLLAMTARHALAFSRRNPPEFCYQLPAPFKQRAQGMPGAWCARRRVCESRE
jgi:hypothetical protein